MSQDLAAEVSGRSLVSIEVISGRYTKKPLEGLTEVNVELPTKIIGAGCHGKFIFILTSSGYNIWNTLGMTGRWTRSRSKHSRVKFSFSDRTEIYFEDVRNFGTLKCVYGKDKLLRKLKSLGPDLLSQDIDEDFFVNRMREKNSKNITAVMMDQKVFAGVGNYIKAEALWITKIDPTLYVEDISDKKLKKLCATIKNVMKESYTSGGSTFRSYKNFSDAPGDYSHRFLCYGRKIDAEGNSVEKLKTADGRTTHWSPDRQKEKK